MPIRDNVRQRIDRRVSANLLSPPSQFDPNPPSTIDCPGTTKLNITVANASVYYSLGYSVGDGDIVNWGNETILIPGFYSLGRYCDAVRFRQATSGAIVTIEALTESDIT